MQFSLVICTYKRPSSLKRLLDSVQKQVLYPNEIVIIDGSPHKASKIMLQNEKYKKLSYHQVKPEHRGLTKQRNIGVKLCKEKTDMICFLDDDITLDKNYFKNLIRTYEDYPEAIAVGGYINNEVKWEKIQKRTNGNKYFYFEGFSRLESKRHRLRRILGLAPDRPPCHLPEFSHGYSIGHIPPSGKTYEVEQFMGGVSSYKTSVFEKINFSSFYEGYGLYEDADFCFRLLKIGKIYVNTSAMCEHHHEASGRPNQFKYGKMVVINGWYVWRIRWPNPSFKNKIKWSAVTLLLLVLRFLNTFTTADKSQAITESFGRLSGLLILLIKKPKVI